MPEPLGNEIERLGRELESWTAPVPRGRYLLLRESPGRRWRPSSLAGAAMILILFALASVAVGGLLAHPALRATFVQMVTRERPPAPLNPGPILPSPTPSPLVPALPPTYAPSPQATEPTYTVPEPAPEPSEAPDRESSTESAATRPLTTVTPAPESEGADRSSSKDD